MVAPILGSTSRTPRRLVEPSEPAWLWPALVWLLGAVAYLPSLQGVFVLDDLRSLVTNPAWTRPGAGWSAFWPPADGSPVTGRPLVYWTFWLNHALGGASPVGYHLVNMAVHLGTATLLGLVAADTFEALAGRSARRWGWWLALLWVVHPLTTAAVTYVVQRTESLCAFWYLATLYTFLRAARGEVARSGRWLGLALACAVAGMLTKEVMVTAPVVILLYDRTFLAGSFRRTWVLRGRWHLALAATWLVLLAVIVPTWDRAGSAGWGQGLAVSDYLATQAWALVRYASLAVWPEPLVFDYGTVTWHWSEVWPQAALVVGGLAWTLRALVKRPAVGFLGATFFLLLAPSSSVAPVVTQTVGEHRMYLPLAVVLAGGLALLGGVAPRAGRWVVVALVPVLAVGTWQRNVAYGDAEGLWRSSANALPVNPRAHYTLGNLAQARGDSAAALGRYREAVRLRPDYAQAHDALGTLLRAGGRLDEALTHAREAVRLQPRFVAAQINLGVAALAVERWAEAEIAFAAALAADATAADAAYNLGLVRMRVGRHVDAVEPLRRALARRDDWADARFALGLALARGGRAAESVPVFARLVRDRPTMVEAWANLGNALLASERPGEAITAYETALRLAPGERAITENLALARRMGERRR